MEARTRRWRSLTFLAAAFGSSLADSRPHVSFSTAEGLPSDEVQAAVADARGFLWFTTTDGLARFDGRTFRRYGREHGLEDPFLLGLSIDPDGALWAGAIGGVWRFDPESGGRFSRVPATTSARRWEVLGFARGADGAMWAAASDGLYRLPPGGSAFERDPIDDTARGEGRDVLFDRSGNLWYATSVRVWRRSPNGALAIATEPGAPGPAGAGDLLLDGSGRVWMTTENGVCVVEDPSLSSTACRPVPSEELRRAVAGGLLEDADGGIWVGTRDGVFHVDATTRACARFAPGHLRGEISPLIADGRGGLWLSLAENGMERWLPSGVRRFDVEDGFEPLGIAGIARDRSGALFVVAGQHRLLRWDGTRFARGAPRLPAGLRNSGWGWGQVELQDRDGRWWIATGEGVLRYPRPAPHEDIGRVAPEAWLTEKDGLPGHDVFRLYEDREGNVWISTLDANPRASLSRWVRATGAFDLFGAPEGLPPLAAPTSFAEDRDGTLWVGFYTGQLARRRGDRFEQIGGAGITHGSIPWLFSDRRGRLWVATSRGLFRCDDPGAAEPRFTRYGRSERLGADRIRAIAEDGSGRLFVATAAGVDVLDPETGVVWPLTRRDGLPPGLAMCLFFDGREMWYGTTRGLAVIDPERVAARRPPPDPLVDGLLVGGVARPVRASGLSEVGGIVLRADERQLQVDVVAPTVDPAEVVRLQYRLGDAPWSAPSAERSVLLANVAPGRARLEIRAVAIDGTPSSTSAIVAFRALAPWWKRPWFLGLVGLALAGVAAAANRARVNRLVALERQRTRIAMDLHDEVGSGLGSIGLLADLAADASVPDERRRALADEVGSIASELGGAMGEIVWSLRPGSETVEAFSRHLVERARRIFPGGGATLAVETPSDRPSDTMCLATRRHAMLLTLEALHNAARHSGATRVELRLERSGRRWVITVTDDGGGMPEAAEDGPGMGLANMRRRADRIGAELEVASSPAGGTRVRLTFDPKAEERGPA